VSAGLQRQVFVCRDHVLEDVLDALSAALAADGVEVLRGPPTVPGGRLVYPPAEYPHWFGRCDAAVFTSRSHVPRELIASSPRLRGIVNVAVGLETIDIDAASELGVLVAHGAVPENTLSMAEAAVMLMLNLRYQLRASEEVLQGRRERPRARADAMHARMLRGCTIGLVGFGRIGRAVAQLLQPFGVTLLASAPRLRRESLPPGVEPVPLPELLARSDIVGVFASASAANRHLIGAAELARMKPTAYLVNVARGELVDEDALEQALRARRIAGAALDVFAVEPLPAGSPLRTLDNVILTPHLVGHTRELYEAFGQAAHANIHDLLQGRLPRYCKNPQAEQAWRERLARIELAGE
jgi:D-3-phosphoglycerate dehydrogenase